MRCHCQAFPTFLILTTLIGVTRADATPRLRASWTEKDARVVVFSPDGRSLVSSGGEGHQLRDAETGRVRAVLSEPRVQFNGPVFSPDSRILYAEVGSDEFKPVGVQDLIVWDVATGQRRGSFAHVTEAVLDGGHFALSHDGGKLAFLDNSERRPMQVKTSKTDFDGQTFDVTFNVNAGLPRVRIWDVTRWEQTAQVDGGPPLAFSPDGKTLVTGDRDWRAPVGKVWETSTGRLRSELKHRSPGIWPIAISHDGRFAASGEFGDKSVWELADGRRWTVGTKGTGLHSRGPVFSPDGKLLFPNGLPRIDPQIGQGEEYYCFDLTTMPPSRLDLGPGELIISPDGRRYAAVRGERNIGEPCTLTLYDLPSLRESGRFNITGLCGAEFSPDGRWLALLVGRHQVIPPGSETRYVLEIRLLDPATARVLVTIPSPGPTWGNYGFKFSPDGNSLAIYYRTGSNISRLGDPDPAFRPMNVEIWEIPPV